MTKEEFIQQHRASMQAYNRRGWTIIIIGCVFLIGCMILVDQVLMPLEQEGYFDWAVSFDEYTIRGIAGCLVLMLAFAFSRSDIIQSSQSLGVPCQACGNKTNVRVAVITGNCGFCGEKVLDNEGPSPTEIFKIIKFHD